MRQRTGERTVAYAIRFKEQAVECEFGDNYEERILEHLIMTVKNEKIIQRCTSKNWDLSELFKKADEEENMSRDIIFPTMWYVRPAKPQISLRIRPVRSENLLVA